MGSITFKNNDIEVTVDSSNPIATQIQQAIDAGKQWKILNNQVIIED